MVFVWISSCKNGFELEPLAPYHEFWEWVNGEELGQLWVFVNVHLQHNGLLVLCLISPTLTTLRGMSLVAFCTTSNCGLKFTQAGHLRDWLHLGMIVITTKVQRTPPARWDICVGSCGEKYLVHGLSLGSAPNRLLLSLLREIAKLTFNCIEPCYVSLERELILKILEFSRTLDTLNLGRQYKCRS